MPRRWARRSPGIRAIRLSFSRSIRCVGIAVREGQIRGVLRITRERVTPTRSLWYPHFYFPFLLLPFPSLRGGDAMTRESEEKEKEARSNERCPLNAGFMSPFITPPDENVSPQANELEGVATLIPSPPLYCVIIPGTPSLVTR